MNEKNIKQILIEKERYRKEREENKRKKKELLKKEINDSVKKIKKDEEKKKLEIEAFDEFMAMLGEEDLEEAFSRKKPNLKDFKVDINGEEISYDRNTMRKPSGVELKLTSEHIKEIDYCFKHPIYTIKNYITIINQDVGKMKFELYPYQAKFIQTCFSNKRVIANYPRQAGKTTTASAFMLIFSIFNKDKTVAIVANKQDTAKEILERIKLMYDYLPMWMKPGILEWNKTSVVFSNGCKIIASATSSDSIRGQSIALLYLDEFAFIPKNLVSRFIESTFPVISSSKLARIIITSTPNGKNHFYKFFIDAEKGLSAFTALRIRWNDVPGRDEKWRQERIAELGSIEKFNQEYGAEFIDASNLAFSGDTLNHIDKIQVTEPLYGGVKEIDGLRVYERPISGQKYLILVDVAEGKLQDSSTMTVIDITNDNTYNIVATYASDSISTIDFPEVIYEIALYYFDAFIIIENNSVGDGVLNELWYNYEYSNVFSQDFTREYKTLKKAYHELGVRMNKKNKKVGVLYLSHLLNNFKIYIPDSRIVDELYTFIKKDNGTFGASPGNHDDFVMNLVLFAFLVKTSSAFDLLKSSYKDYDKDIDDFNDMTIFNISGNRLRNSNIEEASNNADELLYKLLME